VRTRAQTKAAGEAEKQNKVENKESVPRRASYSLEEAKAMQVHIQRYMCVCVCIYIYIYI
jgi:hypothetical protein